MRQIDGQDGHKLFYQSISTFADQLGRPVVLQLFSLLTVILCVPRQHHRSTDAKRENEEHIK